jgi:hypothetical protein
VCVYVCVCVFAIVCKGRYFKSLRMPLTSNTDDILVKLQVSSPEQQLGTRQALGPDFKQ